MQSIAWISGSQGNLGAAIVHRFVEEGYLVIGTMAHGERLAPQMPRIELRPLDLTDEEAVFHSISADIQQFGKIDVAVMTAGGFDMGDIGQTGLGAIHAQLQLNFDTAYNALRPILAHMKKSGRGRIFLVGSRPGLDMRNGKGMTAYSLAKSLIFRLAELVNEEVHGLDIVCAVVVPGIIDTPQNRKSMPEADFNAWVSPDAIAETICYHASPAAAHLRETLLKVYGKS